MSGIPAHTGREELGRGFFFFSALFSASTRALDFFVNLGEARRLMGTNAASLGEEGALGEAAPALATLAALAAWRVFGGMVVDRLVQVMFADATNSFIELPDWWLPGWCKMR